MKKEAVQRAFAVHAPLFYSRYNDWAKGYGGEEVTLVSAEHAHWVYNRATDQYETRTNASKFGAFGFRTTTGYQVQDKAGRRMIVTSTQLRGTWADCQKTITDNNQAAKDAAERDATRRADFDELLGDIGAFGLHVQSWSVDHQNVIVSGPALLALLRELQKG